MADDDDCKQTLNDSQNVDTVRDDAYLTASGTCEGQHSVETTDIVSEKADVIVTEGADVSTLEDGQTSIKRVNQEAQSHSGDTMTER